MRLPLALTVASVLALVLGPPAYARLLAAEAGAISALVPRARPPLAVQVEDGRLRVVAHDRVGTVSAAAVGWNLPLLVVAWAWVLRGRWRGLLVCAAVLVLLHGVIVELEVRRLSGPLTGLPYAALRAWSHGGQSLLAMLPVAVAFGRARPGARREAGPA